MDHLHNWNTISVTEDIEPALQFYIARLCLNL